MIIAYNNKITDSTTMTFSSELTGYPSSDILVKQLVRIFSFDGNSGNIVFDLGSAQDVTCVIIGNTNMTSSGTITVQGNASDSWGAPTYSQVITFNTESTNQMLILDESFRYWRIVFSDATLTDITIGYVFIGEYLLMPGISTDVKDILESKDIKSISRSGQVYGSTEYTPQIIEVMFPAIEDTTGTYASKSELKTFFRAVTHITPFFMVLWENEPTRIPPLFCTLDDNKMEFDRDVDNVYNGSMTFLEAR